MTRKLNLAWLLTAAVAMFALFASPASATFTSANYPTNASGTSTADVLDSFGSTVKCTESAFAVEKVGGGSITEASEQVTVKPSIKKCTAFGLPMTVNFTSCDYIFTSPPGSGSLSLDVACKTPGDAIDITVFTTSAHTTPICHLTIPAQTGKTGATASNSGNNIVLTGTIGSLTAKQVRNSAFCPAGEHTTTATYTIQAGGITLTGSNGRISVD